jgi:hypothetical protein
MRFNSVTRCDNSVWSLGLITGYRLTDKGKRAAAMLCSSCSTSASAGRWPGSVTDRLAEGLAIVWILITIGVPEAIDWLRILQLLT